MADMRAKNSIARSSTPTVFPYVTWTKQKTSDLLLFIQWEEKETWQPSLLRSKYHQQTSNCLRGI